MITSKLSSEFTVTVISCVNNNLIDMVYVYVLSCTSGLMPRLDQISWKTIDFILILVNHAH